MSAVPDTAGHSRLEHFPITFFATIMGLAGFTLAVRAAERALGLAATASHAMLALSLAALAAVALLYGMKALRHWPAVFAEWHHPVRLAFFPTVSVSLLLIAVAMLAEWPRAAFGFWVAGTALQAVLTIAVISGWIGTRSFQHGHLNPAWFIPAVGNVIVPVAGAQMGYVEVSYLFFSAGIVFWLVLLTLVFNRLVFHDPLPGRLQPTLVILIAPPAVAFIAWVRMQGGVDPFAHVLLSVAYVFAVLVLVQAPRILRLPFALSFWALSFPLAALTIASFLYAEKAESAVHRGIGLGLLALLAVVIAGLLGRTLLAITRGEICQPE
jgi:tellurite resistance protein